MQLLLLTIIKGIFMVEHFSEGSLKYFSIYTAANSHRVNTLNLEVILSLSSLSTHSVVSVILLSLNCICLCHVLDKGVFMSGTMCPYATLEDISYATHIFMHLRTIYQSHVHDELLKALSHYGWFLFFVAELSWKSSST